MRQTCLVVWEFTSIVKLSVFCACSLAAQLHHQSADPCHGRRLAFQPSRALHRLRLAFRDSHACAGFSDRLHLFLSNPPVHVHIHTQHALLVKVATRPVQRQQPPRNNHGGTLGRRERCCKYIYLHPWSSGTGRT